MKQDMDIGDVMARVFAVIEGRRDADPNTSYVAKLYARGPAKIAQKVGEEAVETALAAVTGKPEDVVAESTDLLFHLMVLWAALGIKPADVAAELARREGLSGIEEKKSRNW